MTVFFCVDAGTQYADLSPWIRTAADPVQANNIVNNQVRVQRQAGNRLYIPGLNSCSAYVIVTNTHIYVQHNVQILANGTLQTPNTADTRFTAFYNNSHGQNEVIQQRFAIAASAVDNQDWTRPAYATQLSGAGGTMTAQIDVTTLTVAAVTHGGAGWTLSANLFAVTPRMEWATPQSARVNVP